MIRYIFLITFGVFSVIHLYATKRNARFLRGCTKGYILFSLLSFYILCVGEENASWFVVLAIIFSFVGDMLLIPHGTKWFALGGIQFMISHIFFILSFSVHTDFNLVPWWSIALILVLFITATLFIFKKLKSYIPTKALFYPMLMYLIINGTMNSFAIFRMIACVNLASIITVIGGILFFISDTSLFFVRFNKNSRMKSHFLVMITYSIAEFLIILGFIL